jgi:rhamnose transport system ATP-binding protein
MAADHLDRALRRGRRRHPGARQQKVVLSKWLASEPLMLLMDEPTRGVDVGAKAEIHRLMGELVEQGLAILMISSELPEIMGMSDRILVMREGRIVAEFDRARATQAAVASAMMGGSSHAEKPPVIQTVDA